MRRMTIAAATPPFGSRSQRGDRLARLYATLAAEGIEIEVVVLGAFESRGGRREIAHGLTEITVPRSPLHAHVERTLRQGPEPFDAGHLLATQHRLTPHFVAEIERSARDSSVVLAASPHVAPILSVWTAAPLVLDARRGTRAAPAIQDRVVRTAALVIASSPRQAAWLERQHGIDARKVAIVPDAIDHAGVRYVAPEARAGRAAALGLDRRPLAVAFADRVSHVFEAAANARPDMRFLVDGVPPAVREPGRWLEPPIVPDNVEVGLVSERRLADALAVASVAIREEPEVPGAAPELLLAAAAGVPLLAGDAARDLGLPAAPIAGDLDAAIGALLAEDPVSVEERVRAAAAAARARTWGASTRALLEDDRFQALLETTTRPLRRARRARVLA